MISKPSLRTLINRRLGDAKVLLKNRRYAASIYMAGYGLELALKYRICKLMEFSKGFPENRSDFSLYYDDARRVFLRQTIRNLREIRHHDLSELLHYSGEQLNIESGLLEEWSSIVTWHPGMRYNSNSIRMQLAKDFFKNANIIISQIL
jgi:HEPN domain-containing protein